MNDLDKAVRELFDIYQSKKYEVEAQRKTINKPWKTNCSFTITPDIAQTAKNIQVCDLDKIFSFALHLTSLYDAHDETVNALGLKAYPRHYMGYSYTDWFDDFEKRIAQINIKEQEKELQEIGDRLSKVLSPEEQRRMEIEALSKLLKK